MKIRKVSQSAGLVATVIDSLESQSETDGLSANQGRILNEKITNATTYSTEEQVIGTWIDGKPLYRKTISAYIEKRNQAYKIAHNIENVENIWVDLGKSFYNYGGSLPFGFKSGDNYINVRTENDIISIYVSAWEGNTAYVTLNYTKTTD